MDLLLKAAIVAVVAIVVLVGLYYSSQRIFTQQMTEQRAEGLIVSDLRKVPGAVVNITNASPSSIYAGSWHVLASVILNATSPCPSYFIYSYDYPALGLVNRTENIYTENCNIYVFSPSGAFSLGSAPVAIAWASKHVPSAIAYISRFGISNVNAFAHYRINATSGGTWLLNYTSRLANYTVHASIADTNGTLLNSYNASH